MGAFLTWQPPAGPALSLFFDVVSEESVTLSAQSTDFPVETGVDISDHVHDERDRCSLEVFISNQPIYAGPYGGRIKQLDLSPGAPGRKLHYSPPLEATPGSVFGAVGGAVKGAIRSLSGTSPAEPSARVLQWDQPFDAVADTTQVLEELKRTKQLVTIVTRARFLENMLLESVVVTRDVSTGDGARARLDFRQLRLVEAKIVTAPIPTEIRGATKRSMGAQSAKDAKAPEAKKQISVLQKARKLRRGES